MNQSPADDFSATSSQASKHCFWMTAGVISYRLCQLQFDCDNCEFDAVMRKRQRPTDGTSHRPQPPTAPDTR